MIAYPHNVCTFVIKYTCSDIRHCKCSVYILFPVKMHSNYYYMILILSVVEHWLNAQNMICQNTLHGKENTHILQKLVIDEKTSDQRSICVLKFKTNL